MPTIRSSSFRHMVLGEGSNTPADSSPATEPSEIKWRDAGCPPDRSTAQGVKCEFQKRNASRARAGARPLFVGQVRWFSLAALASPPVTIHGASGSNRYDIECSFYPIRCTV